MLSDSLTVLGANKIGGQLNICRTACRCYVNFDLPEMGFLVGHPLGVAHQETHEHYQHFV